MDLSFPVPPTTPTPTEGFAFASDPTPSTTPPTGPSNGAIQLSTIFATVTGLVGFILLVLASSYIFRISYFKRQSGAPSALPLPRPWSHNYIRRPSPIQHVESTIVSSTLTHWSQPYDHDTRYLPPYEGPSPPPYSEAMQHTLNPQHLRVPPIAVVEA